MTRARFPGIAEPEWDCSFPHCLQGTKKDKKGCPANLHELTTRVPPKSSDGFCLSAQSEGSSPATGVINAGRDVHLHVLRPTWGIYQPWLFLASLRLFPQPSENRVWQPLDHAQKRKGICPMPHSPLGWLGGSGDHRRPSSVVAFCSAVRRTPTGKTRHSEGMH